MNDSNFPSRIYTHLTSLTAHFAADSASVFLACLGPVVEKHSLILYTCHSYPLRQKIGTCPYPYPIKDTRSWRGLEKRRRTSGNPGSLRENGCSKISLVVINLCFCSAGADIRGCPYSRM